MNKLMDLLKTAREFWDLHPHWAVIAVSFLLVFLIGALR